MKKAAPKKQMGGKAPERKSTLERIETKYKKTLKPLPGKSMPKKRTGETTPMPPKMEGSETAKMMMKFGGKTGAPAKRVGGARAYDSQIGKKKGMNKG